MDAGTLGYLDSRDTVFITTSLFEAQLFIRPFEITVGADDHQRNTRIGALISLRDFLMPIPRGSLC